MKIAWQRAATIDERLSAVPVDSWNSENAQRRYARWRTLPAFSAPGATDERALAPLGLTPATLLSMLAEPDSSLELRLETPPAWAVTFERWWQAGAAIVRDPAEDDYPDLRLLSALLPLILGARHELTHKLGDLLDDAGDERFTQGAPLRHDLMNSVLNSPPIEELSLIAAPTLILEINVARENGTLEGDTPDERFDAFVRRASEPDAALALLSEYPVLLRSATERLKFWLSRRIEFASALVADMDVVTERFFKGPPGTLEVEFGQGDSHRQGRSVAIVATDSGKVVFKPRSPAMDKGFDRVVDWFNGTTPPHDLMVPQSVPRTAYAWFEHIETADAADHAASERCVWRLGALNALLHMLRATDMHYENVLIAGDHPYAIDLESLLHTDKRYANTEVQPVANVAHLALSDSALAVGILPNKIVTGKPGHLEVSDISPIGVRDGQRGAVTMPFLVDGERDTVRLGSEHPMMDGPARGDHSHTQEDTVRDLVQHIPFDEGFTWTYRKVMENSTTWLDGSGVLSEFAGARARYIPRPTMIYAKVLSESYHPDFMRDGLDRALCLGKLLAGYWDRPTRDALVHAEIEDLLAGDIPFFEIDVLSGDIVKSETGERIERDGESPLTAVTHLLDTISDDDLATQRQIIDYSFATAKISSSAGHDAAGNTPPVDTTSGVAEKPAPGRAARYPRASDDEKLCAAVACADLLIDRMVRRRDGVGWLTLTAVSEKHWVISPTVMDLYAGLSGIGAALATVGTASGDDRISSIAQEVMDQVGRYDRLILTDDRSIAKTREAFSTGAYGHLTGMAVALADAADRYGRGEYRTTALRTLDLVAHLIDGDPHADIVSGNGGALLGTLAVAETASVPGLETMIRNQAAHLVSTSVESDGAIAWGQSDGGRPLVGFSHGTTGIALALARAGQLLGDDSFEDAARQALAFDRRHIVHATGDWLDLRDPGTERGDDSGHMRAWCHGSPGAGLGRAELLSLGLLPDQHDILRDELRLARSATAESVLHRGTERVGLGNHSLCHGDIGNLLTLEAMLRSEDPDQDVADITGSTWSALCDRGRHSGWASGVPGDVVVPGLMMGIAGIAWGLAFSARPAGELDLLTLRRSQAVSR